MPIWESDYPELLSNLSVAKARGGTVFTCGSTDWSHGLRGGDVAVDRITRNVLEKLGK